MARTEALRSATSQFFINVADNRAKLDHHGFAPEDFGYAVFGRVLSGMDVCDRIAAVPTTALRPHDDVPIDPVVIKGVRRDPVADHRMSRPLLVIFLTIFVNLVGFGIIIPLLPFYAQTFGASPLVVGLLFASFSLGQLVASPLLGDLSDRWGRRPVLILSLIGTAVSFAMLAVAQSLVMLFAARIVDGLSGGNITTARAYIADITEEENRAKAYGVLGAAFGLGFIVGPALGAAFSHISLTAPIWAAAAITVAATVMAWVWLPETVHRAHAGGGAPWHAVRVESPSGPPAAASDRLHLLDVVCGLPDDVCAVRRASIRLRRDPTGYLLSAFGVARGDRPGRAGRPDCPRDRQPSDPGHRPRCRGGRDGSAAR